MRLPATLAGFCAGLIAVAALIGCGEPSEREQLEDYLDQANAALERSAPEFKRAQSAYKRYTKGDLTDNAPRKLELAEDTIRSAQGELEDLDPPEVAESLDLRLLRLFSQYADFARETSQLATYLPAAADVSLELTRANQRLSEGLQTEEQSKGQEDALTDFARAIEQVISDLKQLSPPRVLVNTNAERIAGLESVHSLALRLATALNQQDAVKTAHLLVKFRRSTSEQADEGIDRHSLRAYDRRFKRLALAEDAVKREEAQLASSLAAPAQGGG